MTASARFWVFLAVITFLGCSSAETEVAGPGSNAKQGQDKKPVVAKTDSDSAKESESSRPATSVLTEEEEPSDLLSLSELTLPNLSASEPVPLSDPAVSEEPFAEENPIDLVASNTTLPEMTLLEQAPMIPFGSEAPETPAETPTAALPETNATTPSPSEIPENNNSNPLHTSEASDPARANVGNPLRPASGGESSNESLESSDPQEKISPETTETNPIDTPLPAGDEPTAQSRPNSKGQPFDPIKENGPIFVDWPKPELAIVMTGRQNGYVEPCGCAGMERMTGGLSRRDTLIKDLSEKRQWPVVAVDIGNQVKDHKRQTELKFQHTAESMFAMGYAGIGLGIDDLQLPAGELAAITSNDNSPFVSANVDLLEEGTELIAKYRIVERNGVKIGITAILGNSYRSQLNSKSTPTTDPSTAIEQVAESLAPCEVRILLAYADREESEALAKRFPMFNIVVTAAGGSEPPKESVVVPGTKTYLVEVGEKGMCAVVLGIYRDRDHPVRYQRVLLDSRFAPSEKIHRLMSAYQEQLKILGLEGLKVKPVPCPESETKGKYVGSKACATCHEISYDIWRKSKHAHAWKTLVEADPPRNHDPECISCHVIGWDPQRYYPFVGGFVSSEKTPELENVGCESCHGPGGAHVDAEAGGDMELQRKLQKAMVVTVEESRSNPQKMCYNCHDLDNSPEFDFDKYWPEVEHYETEDDDEKEEK